MHHHVIGLGTLALVAAIAEGPTLVRDFGPSLPAGVADRAPAAGPVDGTLRAEREMLDAALDQRITTGRSGDLGEALDRFTSDLQRRAHISDGEVRALDDAASGPVSREFLRTLAATVRDPSSVTPGSTATLADHERRMIDDLVVTLRQSAASR